MVDRRAFLKASLLTAGSALVSLIGCSDPGITIPCLGPAPPPTPVPGMTYVKASEIGCALDCDLRTGRNKHTGGTATDDGPRLNAALATATADNPITLIIDGSALVSGLFLPSAGHWSIAGLGCGTGFFVKSGTNNDGIHNGAPNAATPSDPGPPGPARGMNVSLSNFTVNGNRGDGFHGNSTTGSQQGSKRTWYFGINLMNLDNVTIEKVVVVNTPAYHIRLSNVGNVQVTGCVLQTRGMSTDGLHFDGPANDISISDCDFTTGDDSIALNCPEGYSGDISRVTVTGCTFRSVSLMRLYTTNGGPKFTINDVQISNCSGYASESAFLIGVNNAGALPNSIASLTISDCVLNAPAILGVAENFGNIILKNVTFNPVQSGVAWVSPQSSHILAFLRPSPLYGGVTYSGSSLTFENCSVGTYGNLSVAAVILDSDSTVENVTFNGFGLQNSGSPPLPDLLYVGPGSIGQLFFDSLQSTNIDAPISASEFSNIGSVSGSGVLATGWEFPDAVMADGVPFISASTGQPTIKVAGVAKPYPG